MRVALIPEPGAAPFARDRVLSPLIVPGTQLSIDGGRLESNWRAVPVLHCPTVDVCLKPFLNPISCCSVKFFFDLPPVLVIRWHFGFALHCGNVRVSRISFQCGTFSSAATVDLCQSAANHQIRRLRYDGHQSWSHRYPRSARCLEHGLLRSISLLQGLSSANRGWYGFVFFAALFNWW